MLTRFDDDVHDLPKAAPAEPTRCIRVDSSTHSVKAPDLVRDEACADDLQGGEISTGAPKTRL